MKLAQVAVIAESGEWLWDGSLTSFLHANNDFPNEFQAIDWRALCADLRAGINTPHGRPEPATLGGGASPVVYVSLLESEPLALDTCPHCDPNQRQQHGPDYRYPYTCRYCGHKEEA